MHTQSEKHCYKPNTIDQVIFWTYLILHPGQPSVKALGTPTLFLCWIIYSVSLMRIHKKCASLCSHGQEWYLLTTNVYFSTCLLYKQTKEWLWLLHYYLHESLSSMSFWSPLCVGCPPKLFLIRWKCPHSSTQAPCLCSGSSYPLYSLLCPNLIGSKLTADTR